MKRFFCLIFCAILALLSMLQAFGDEAPKYTLVDRMGILSPSDRSLILSYMEQASEKGYSLVVVLTSTLSENATRREEYCEEYYSLNGYHDEGIMLYVGVESRSYDIYSCHKNDFSEISEKELDIIDTHVYSALHNNDFARAATIFAEYSYGYIVSGTSETYYDGKTSSSIGFEILISFVIAFAIATIILLVMKSKMKMIKPQRSAANYVDRQSVRLKATHDSFLYSTITKVKRESGSSGGSSRSGGGSHRGGRF